MGKSKVSPICLKNMGLSMKYSKTKGNDQNAVTMENQDIGFVDNYAAYYQNWTRAAFGKLQHIIKIPIK